MDKGYLAFDVKTGMKNIIGKDLITDDFIAIYELVKNAYDAYADYVKITFKSDEIIIADNGKGMSKKDLEEKWFAVAYSAKSDGSEDNNDNKNRRESHLNNLKSRRFYAGAKGVGRFSCDRLGDTLDLITSKVDLYQTYKVNVEWSEFEKDAKQSFDSVNIPFEEIENTQLFPKEKSHGTILRIRKLNSNWDEKKLIDLKISLEKLINPFSNENDFSIEIEVSNLKYLNQLQVTGINGIVGNNILKVLDLKTTQLDLKVNSEIISTKIFDRGVLIYHIEEPNDYRCLIDDLEINLYFLNRSAKVNFGKLMDIEPVNYGNVFLYKNGFRVQPYGNIGDDSWEIDNRKQQGYNRFLGTRDLFGRVDLTTDKNNEFKEVSSRDGGLVESTGKRRLFEIFQDKALKRLERYVVGVLWGEGFKRRNYFLDIELADKFRQDLSEDKNKDSYEDALNNLGSKIDFVNLIKTLSDDKNIKIISYNKDLVDLVNEQLDVVQPKFIADLEKIAERTNDQNLLTQVKLTEDSFNKILKEKEEAERREDEEREKRIDAEKRVELEKQKREEAETKQKEEQERRIKAELVSTKAELAKLKAENRARDEEELRLLAEQKAKEEEEKGQKISEQLNIETQKNQYLNATRKTLSDDAEQLVHSIDLYVGNASTYVNELLISDIDNKSKEKVYSIKNNIDKALKISQIIIKSNFDYKHTSLRVNLPMYINEYLEDIKISRPKLEVEISNLFDKYYLLNPIDIDIIIDNLISNSIKAKATKVLVEFDKNEDQIVIMYSDNGIGMPERLVNNPKAIFELGVRESNERGSGIGMFDVKKRVENIMGKIEFAGNNTKLKGAAFKIVV